MKRSEMIKHIVIAHSTLDFRGESYDYNELAEHLLSHMEKVGMLPPFNPQIEESKLGYGAAYLDDESVRNNYCKHFCQWSTDEEKWDI